MNPRNRVAIIGAGASGLAAIKVALDYGMQPIAFEKSNNIGGLWVYKTAEENCSSVMKTTVMNTSKEMTAYSTYPPAEDLPKFMHHTDMVRYFHSYAKHYGLLQHIVFNCQVVLVERSPNYAENGQWVVHYKTSGNDTTDSQTFDAILVAVGHHASPHFPEFRGQSAFQGQIIHSNTYKHHRGYEDKICVVVGVGNSGADVAVELSRICKEVYLSSRRGTWVINRLTDYGRPFDLVWGTRFNRCFLPSALFQRIIEHKLNKRFDHEVYGLKPKHSVFSAHSTINDELPFRISCGSCKIRPNIAKFTKNGVLFDDGSAVDNVDTVIFCTGYNTALPIIENGTLIATEHNEFQAYKYMFPFATADHNTLGIIGMIQPLGATAPIAEMQARVFFEVFLANIRLPTREQMLAEETDRRRRLAIRYVQTQRHTIQVDHAAFMDELASMIGAKPTVARYLLTDFQLGKALIFGPNVPYVYRLNGPQTCNGAREAILTLWERTERSTRKQGRDAPGLLEKWSSLARHTVAVTTIVGAAAWWCLLQHSVTER